MTVTPRFTLPKEERICSRILIDRLFGEGSHSISAFPIRAVYTDVERKDGEPAVRIMVSVPKKHFKRAVKRNRVKRQIREAYRLNKYIIINKVEQTPEKSLLIAFIWNENKLHDSDVVTQRVKNLLHRLSEKIGNETVAHND